MGKLRILFICTLIFAMLFFTQTTHAFWSSHIDGTQSNSQATITIGTWDFDDGIPVWEQGVSYQQGQIVSFNGQLYIALRNNPPRGPGQPGGWNFWSPTN
jgi:hypothetical protein